MTATEIRVAVAGRVDPVDDGRVIGWALAPADPAARLDVVVLVRRRWLSGSAAGCQAVWWVAGRPPSARAPLAAT